MRRQDYFGQGSRGVAAARRPGPPTAAAALDAYVEAAGLEEPKAPLFQSMDPSGRRLTGRVLERRVVLAMIKRRAVAAGLPPLTCCHTFRAIGISSRSNSASAAKMPKTRRPAAVVVGHAGFGERGRERTHGNRTAARGESAGSATDALPATRLPSTLPPPANDPRFGVRFWVLVRYPL